mgnify:CR=1 FL=1
MLEQGKKMKIAIHQPHYWPWLPYIQKVQKADLFVYLDDVQFEKNGLQNRCRLEYPGRGLQWLTVPVRHKFGQAINETRIDKRAIRSHLAALLTLFGAKHVEEMRAVYGDHDNLADLAIATTEHVLGKLRIPTTTIRASGVGPSDRKGSARLADLCAELGATTYLAGSGSRNYLDRAPFDAIGCKIVVQRLAVPAFGPSSLQLLLRDGPVLGWGVAVEQCATWEEF